MNARKFLIFAGFALVIIALLGFFGIIGPTPDKSIFGSSWWFDNGENWVHLVVGLFALFATQVLSVHAQKYLAMLLGIFGILIGLYGIVLGNNFLGANLENPMDSILHFVLGAWALWASRGKTNNE